jgi:adenylylsulfate kinase-like enzyme
MIIWVTGLSASGKTTLTKAFEKLYKNDIPNMVLLDGDIIRELYGNDLGYTVDQRIIQIKRLQSFALFLEKQNIVVLVAALYANDDLLKYNKDNFKNYFEVYLRADLETLQKREVKDLYKNALSKKIKNVVGVDIEWVEPKYPNIIFEISDAITPIEMAKMLHNKLF